ncbi:MAG TPA: xanthine dehydrogenase family protein subunit M [Candidatus Acidoferrales bacterium]|nr:xanthine dehydrogenase family protein subunit M [Candidatus Acidoferrales bacterium]HXK02257.1 xanthine dehydrogenase family protein subunit M [Verrucomicrobiae bacterium]
MQNFEYANPSTLQEATSLLSAKWGEADVLAGGTDLISCMKDHLHTPKRVVNIKGIKELEGISKSDAGLRIGALVTMEELATNADVKSMAKALSDAAAGIPSPQIRHMGTVGGDLCQRPRCWYYRNGMGLLAMKDGKSLIPDGENRYHSIFGGGPAYFVSASSLGPALIALGAKIKLVSAKGPREVPAASFFVVPQNENQREIALHADEILTEITIPAGAVKSATYEVRQKEALDWPLAAASVVLHMKGNAVGSAKVVLGHVAPKPWDSSDAAKALAGKTITADTAEAAGKAAVGSAQPLSQNAYKVTLAKVAVKRALLDAAKQKA